jgi:hypothetical protein
MLAAMSTCGAHKVTGPGSAAKPSGRRKVRSIHCGRVSSGGGRNASNPRARRSSSLCIFVFVRSRGVRKGPFGVTKQRPIVPILVLPIVGVPNRTRFPRW